MADEWIEKAQAKWKGLKYFEGGRVGSGYVREIDGKRKLYSEAIAWSKKRMPFKESVLDKVN